MCVDGLRTTTYIGVINTHLQTFVLSVGECKRMDDMNNTVDSHFTSPQVQDLLNVHRNTLRKLIDDGEFPNAFRIGRAIRIPSADIRDFLNRRKVIPSEGVQ